MKRTFLLFATLLLLGIQTFAQTGVAINTTGNDPDTSAMLDVSSTTKGLLIPRMTQAQRMAIALPAKGLLVYQNDGTEGFYYYDGSAWKNLSLVNFSESNFTYNSKTGVKFTPNNAAANVDMILQPKGTGSILAQQPDGTTAGGNKRGTNAVDLQMFRINATQAASGDYSTIVGGAFNTASGKLSTAMGINTIASGEFSTAMGSYTTASGVISTAMGSNTKAIGTFSTAMGENSIASGQHSVAMGNTSTASNETSFAMGTGANASGNTSAAFGISSTASGYGSFSSGLFTQATGDFSTAAGGESVAPSAYEMAVGRYNTIYTPASTTDWNSNDRLFVVGNGTANGSRGNAFTILKNANTTIGGSLTINDNGTNTSYLFPATRGTSGQVLQTDGSGNTSWITPSSGTVTSVSGTFPIFVGTGSSTPVISISAASTTFAGSMSAADKTKLDGIAANANNYTHPTGDGNLHVPATGTGNNGKVLTAGSTAGSLSWVSPSSGTVTSVTGSAPISVATGTTTPDISIAAATTSAAGSMSAADKTKLDELVGSQWTTSGSNIYYSTGNVSIGTTTANAQLQLGNTVVNRKIVLWQNTNNDHQYYGLGVNSYTLRYQLPGTTDSHVFYAGTSATTSDELFRIKGTGEVVIPALSTAGVLQNDASGKISSSIGTSGQVLTTNGSGDVIWSTPYTGLSNFTESNFNYDSRTGVKFTPNNAATDVDFVLQPKGTGAIIAQQPGGTSAGGNKRGNKAVDLQTGRINAAQVASGDYATLIGGRGNTASGNYSVAMGLGSSASGENSTAIGSGTSASGTNSTAMGEGATASGNTSTAMGEVTKASGDFTTALGYNTSALSGFETVAGSFNSAYTPSSTTAWVATDQLFVIGNGTADGARSNALTILKNANTTVGGSLTVNGNGTNTSITFPTTRGTLGQVLSTSGSGGLGWITPANGTVTNVSGTSPISVATGTSTPVISISAATTSADGSMSAADKIKLDAQTTGTASGQMQYWNGTAWVTVAAGQEGQFLRYSNSTPTWVNLSEIDLLQIGDNYQGGIIAYFLQPWDPGYDANVRHGLIAAPSDQSTGTQWGCWGTAITGADGTALGTGNQNTIDIEAGCTTAGTAADICANLSINGYTDWYLPSKDELHKLYLNKNAIGGFASASYWSSTEYSNTDAWIQNFVYGNQYGYPKDNTYRVRAVRAF